MKLYATTTSERASKGQGGNEYIQITLTRQIAGENIPIYFIYFDINKIVIQAIPEQKEVLRIETKGKSQKGECKHFIIKDDYGKEYCQECGTYNNLN